MASPVTDGMGRAHAVPVAYERGSNSCCVVIPAIKKSAVIPDQLVKKLAGKTLIQRALETALGFASGADIHVVTDSEEISLICHRAGVRAIYNPEFTIASLDIVQALRHTLDELAQGYEHLVIYRASCPLVTSADISDAYRQFATERADCLVTLKSVRHRLWSTRGGDVNALLFNEEQESAYIETKALVMLCRSALIRPDGAGPLKVLPYFLNDRAVEINSYQDWWICEKLLLRKNIVFVVAGYPAIGMGHIYRSLMFAHEIADHRITFVCTAESELAAANIAARDYKTKVQQGNLARDVLALDPHLVINDMLDTDAAYIGALKDAGVKVVCFEDEGSGAPLADLAVNALYEGQPASRQLLAGYRYFCLRDEFVTGKRNRFRKTVKKLLVTFGGTDLPDFTRRTLAVVDAYCAANGIMVHVVTGPGYAHKEQLEVELAARNAPHISFSAATNIMSHIMEGADMAICSAGRTVYELAHMRIPAIVLAQHQRETTHTFARPRNGFLYLGCMEQFDAAALHEAFMRLLNPLERRELFARMARFNFSGNKARVVERMVRLLE